jgi:4-hydroxymandelate oxidase
VATADVLAEVVAAAGDAPVLVDGGVRTGTDVAVALALGARAVLVGKPVLWALAADGADGVRDLLTAIVDDFAFTMQLLGVTSLATLDRSYVR